MAANHDKGKKVKEVQARVRVANDARHTPHAKLGSVVSQHQEKVDVKSSVISIVLRFGVLDDCSLSPDEKPHVLPRHVEAEAEAELKGQKLELLEAHEKEVGAELKAQMETEKRDKKMEKRLRKKQRKKIVATNNNNKIWVLILMIIICLVFSVFWLIYMYFEVVHQIF